MLIDYIDPHRLPNWVVWLDWCFYAYRTELYIALGGAILGWLLFCFIKQGYPTVG
jgi:hypothetical protein